MKEEHSHQWELCKGKICTSDVHTHHCNICGEHAFHPMKPHEIELRERAYHPIEKILTDFKNGATYSDSIDAIADFWLAERKSEKEELVKKIGEVPEDIDNYNGATYGKFIERQRILDLLAHFKEI